MRCDEFRGAVDLYLDDELSLIDSLRLRGHLLFCQFCGQVAASEAALRALLSDDAISDHPPGPLRDRITQQIRRAQVDASDASSKDAGIMASGSQSAPEAAARIEPRPSDTDGDHPRT